MIVSYRFCGSSDLDTTTEPSGVPVSSITCKSPLIFVAQKRDEKVAPNSHLCVLPPEVTVKDGAALNRID